MNITIADVTDIDSVQVHDEVVIIGRQGGEEITVDEVASQLDTINYEITTRLPEHIKRVVID